MKNLYRKCFQKSAWRFNQLIKNKYRKHGDHRLVLMKDETWRRWNELKKLLNIDSNCKLAELLIDSWYGRQLEYGHSEVKSNSLKVNSNYIDLYTTSSHEADFHEIKTELNSENTGNEPEHENLDDDNRLAGTNIDTGTASTVNGENCGERASARLKEKGVRPNYTNLEDLNYDFESDSNEKLNQTVRDGKRSNSRTENDQNSEVKIQKLLVCDINKSTMKTWKRKKKLSQDPDILINELDKDTNDSMNDDVHKMSDIRSIVKKKRSRKSTTDNDDFKISEVNKLKKLPREKSDNCIIEKPEQKPWISIKLEDHPEKYHIETVGSFERKNRGSNIVDELYTCVLCGRFKSSGKQIFESHIEKHVNGVLQCPQCNYTGRSEVEIANHQAEHGHLSEGRKYVCDLCGVVLYSSDSRLSHMGRVHDDPRFKCKYCDIKSTTRLKRLQHIRSKHPDIAQHCSICKRDFCKSTSVQFKAHISTCKPGYTCQVCGHVFSSKTGLSNHIKHTHMNIRKYQCHMCPYAGKSAKRLKEHIMTHTGSHPYSCDQCTFTCVQSYQLTSHQRTHTGDKPYKCTQCNYAAAWNVQLKDHIKVHSMNSSVLCEPCNILFKNDKAKKMHEKKDH